MNWLNESSTVLSILTKSVLIVLVVILLSSCALLDKLRGGVSPHTDVLITVPVVDKEILEVPVVTEDVRG